MKCQSHKWMYKMTRNPLILHKFQIYVRNLLKNRAHSSPKHDSNMQPKESCFPIRFYSVNIVFQTTILRSTI